MSEREELLTWLRDLNTLEQKAMYVNENGSTHQTNRKLARQLDKSARESFNMHNEENIDERLATG